MLLNDWRLVSQFVLVSSPIWGSWSDFSLGVDSYGFALVRRPLWREDGSVLCQMSQSITLYISSMSQSVYTWHYSQYIPDLCQSRLSRQTLVLFWVPCATTAVFALERSYARPASNLSRLYFRCRASPSAILQQLLFHYLVWLLFYACIIWLYNHKFTMCWKPHAFRGPVCALRNYHLCGRTLFRRRCNFITLVSSTNSLVGQA
jgi:hypothetical protein